MNKAFIKEPEADSGRCPRCDSPGVPVLEETLSAQLPPDLLAQVSSSAYFCPIASCPVVYFDAFERTIDRDQFGKPVYPKDPEAPLCSCFGLTVDDIDADLAEGAPTRTRKAVEQAKSPSARCATLSPSGRSCVAEVQRCYLHRKGS